MTQDLEKLIWVVWLAAVLLLAASLSRDIEEDFRGLLMLASAVCVGLNIALTFGEAKR